MSPLKIMLVTLPLRAVPTVFPPLGVLSIQSYLRKHGVDDVELYNADALRPTYADLLAHVVQAKPDVVGIGAVVSTAYAYTRRLTLDLRRCLPDTLVVVGGNLAASAELLLRRTGTDLCVLGEGERTFLEVVRRAETSRRAADFHGITGLALLDDEGALVNTGYAPALGAGEIYDVQWQDLEDSETIDHYIFPLLQGGELCQDGRLTAGLAAFDRDPRTHEPHRRHGTFCVFVASKGCVARCTFCHRWVKGFRQVPVDLIVSRLRQLMEQRSVGFVSFGDENFGADHRWLRELCHKIAPLDLLWSVGSMRVNRVTPELIAIMRDAGCCNIHYGVESGSDEMLQVMDKRVSVEQNREALRWTLDAGLSSIIQIVLRMPGETGATVRQTTELCRDLGTHSPRQDPTKLAIFYVQALPGTALYEHARQVGLIGPGLDGEERYLLDISDQEAHDPRTSLNFTTFPELSTLCWPLQIQLEVNHAYVTKYGPDHYFRQVFGPVDSGPARPPGLWSRLRARLRGEEPRRFPITRCHPVLFYHLRHFGLLFILTREARRHGAARAWALTTEYLRRRWQVGRQASTPEYRSLRESVQEVEAPGGPPQMEPLRRGR